MEFGAEYTFSNPDQFWSELEDLISLSPMSSLAELDYALRNYIAFASHFMDEYLSTPTSLDTALLALLSSPLFTSHVDRQTSNIISTITPTATSSSLFISLMLILHLGMSNPLASSSSLLHADSQGAMGNNKVFRAMRGKWNEVVPVLMKWVWDADVVQEVVSTGAEGGNGSASGQQQQHVRGKGEMMPAEGWEERVGTSATAVLYEVCRVQRLNADELSLFTYPFISHLFSLVERTREHEDETFNYTLIKLIIALNEQFMVAALPPPGTGGGGDGGGGTLPPPILPTVKHGKHARRKEEQEHERGTNLVLEVLKAKEGESKTFGENIIFILNRANGSPDSLCVSLLILKILYLLFTTSGTQEYFYTNDLCVLVDVFIRELCDLGEESEGLKHTYLRVLHPLLLNTQLRHHPYKRPQLRRVLLSLISSSHYRECDPTTRRLVERNLRGSWCEGLNDESLGEGERRATERKGSGGMGVGWSSGMGGRGLMASKEATGSTLSVDAIAQAQDVGKVRRRGSATSTSTSFSEGVLSGGFGGPVERTISGSSSTGTTGSPLSNSMILEPVLEGQPALTLSTASSSNKDLPLPPTLTESPPTTPSSLSSSIELPRRRRPPPPPSPNPGPSRPRTPSLTPAHLATTYANGSAAAQTIQPGGPPSGTGRRQAPAPPVAGEGCGRRAANSAREREVQRGLEEEMERRLRGLQVE
ncbi:hypothetical protein BCR35DRAFT_356384 [Leucosporidium creatinivorum]|uniref:SPIN90/Ldb17 leucine-rich domain-containing protein n=1 Tax=Leucosporidium creatinivorum TaxID=106004 RepID=A0A1Y2C745_9BASI|nr:hypothetical protein BCR35DRAFT_356384 [Leucosporidium creatinivorum]